MLSDYVISKNSPKWSPLTSYTWLEVKESDFTVTAIPSSHVTEALTASCVGVAFIHMPRCSVRIAVACYGKQIQRNEFTPAILTARHRGIKVEVLLIWSQRTEFCLGGFQQDDTLRQTHLFTLFSAFVFHDTKSATLLEFELFYKCTSIFRLKCDSVL